jgi:hypothetical protein
MVNATLKENKREPRDEESHEGEEGWDLPVSRFTRIRKRAGGTNAPCESAPAHSKQQVFEMRGILALNRAMWDKAS